MLSEAGGSSILASENRHKGSNICCMRSSVADEEWG